MQPNVPANLAHAWDQRLYPGLRVEAVPAERRTALAQALGALGVEGEHVLDTVRNFLTPPPGVTRSRGEGEAFLWQLEASAKRMKPAAESFEVATQAYLASLEQLFSPMRSATNGSDDSTEPWWSATQGNLIDLSSLDMSLRQCGFSYRHVVMSRLAPTVDALAEQVCLLLHALNTLPPAGVLPAPALYAGLSELASTFQGYVVPHLLGGETPEAPGLLAAIARLHLLDGSEDRSIEADVAWARSQLQEVRWIAEQSRASQRDTAPRRGILAGLLRRGGAPGRPSSSPEAWLEMAEREWQETIRALEMLRTQSSRVGAPIS